MSKEERQHKDLVKALDRNARASEELTKELKRQRITKDQAPRDPAQPEGTEKLKG